MPNENAPDINPDIPGQIKEILYRLNSFSYKAYIVGKCVRELIFEHNAVDYDVITDAAPERILAIFENFPLNTENMEKGEIIVQALGLAVLISPLRCAFTSDGKPIYTDEIILDLARRDFSFNAIAYHPREGWVDPFHGLDCLKRDYGTVSAIGIDMPYVLEEAKREAPEIEGLAPSFERSPATMLQALGYYSSGKYVISNLTKEAIFKYSGNVKNAAKSELRTELSWVLNGKRVTAALEEYSEVIISLIPEFGRLNGFDQHRAEHAFDALRHTFKSVGYASPILTLRYALFFHCLGKPDCFSLDVSGRGHFYGYAERSGIYAERIMTRLGFTEEDIREVCFLIKNHNMKISGDRSSLKLMMRRVSTERLKLLLQFKYADTKAKSSEAEAAANVYKRLVDTVNDIVTFKECYLPEHLAINADDLIRRGAAKDGGEAEILLNRLLTTVIDAPALNTQSKLLQLAERGKK